jgi:hypothetical protein
MPNQEDKSYVVIDDGLFCMISKCEHCESGFRSKVIISYRMAHNMHNSLITTKCIKCFAEETVRLSDVTDE